MAAKDKAKVRTRITQAMIDALNQFEVRAICVHLGLATIQAWRSKPDVRRDWLIEHMADFVAADLDTLDWSNYRPPAKDYLYALQAYAGGNGVVPVLNPLMDAPAESPVAYVEPDVWARTEEEIVEDEDEEIGAAESSGTGDEMAVSRFVKGGLAPKTAAVEEKAPPAPVAAPAAEAAKPVAAAAPRVSSTEKTSGVEDKIHALTDLVEGLGAALAALAESIVGLRAEVAAAREEAALAVSAQEAAGAYLDNGMLFIINTACVAEGEEGVHSLTELPDQSSGKVAADDVPL
jgi:hypothetical protein